MNCRFVGDIGQWLSVLIMLIGAGLMIYYRLDYGTVIFTIGCLIETLATKVKYYGGKALDTIEKGIEAHRENKVIYNRLKSVVDGLNTEQWPMVTEAIRGKTAIPSRSHRRRHSLQHHPFPQKRG